MRGQQGGRRVSGRTLMIVGGLAAVLLLGMLLGDGMTKDRALNTQRGQIVACLPLETAEQVDECLGGSDR